jgi:steroid delta-isomerase-like uncharacterized protein
MSTEQNKALIRRGFEDAINTGKLELLADIVGPTYVNHDMPMEQPGPDGLRQVLAPFLSAFPDFAVTIEDIVGEGDKVVTRGVFTGTQRGAFMGIPATGTAVRVPYMDMWRVEDGKAVENWVRLDTLSLLQQLGAMPSPEQTPG